MFANSSKTLSDQLVNKSKSAFSHTRQQTEPNTCGKSTTRSKLISFSLKMAPADKLEKFYAECAKCNRKRRIILFKPCLHVIWCAKCIWEEFKSVHPSPVIRCQVCAHIVRVFVIVSKKGKFRLYNPKIPARVNLG